jgi:hypothetical protein
MKPAPGSERVDPQKGHVFVPFQTVVPFVVFDECIAIAYTSLHIRVLFKSPVSSI